MRHRESVYGFKERYSDLNNTYKKALSQGNYSTQYDAMAVAVNMPSKRFWVSEERLVEVINAFEGGKDLRVSPKSPRYEMFTELYRRYLEYKAAHPDLAKIEICTVIIYQPAPKFYMKPSWGLKILYRGRAKRPRHYHLRNKVVYNNENTIMTKDKYPKEMLTVEEAAKYLGVSKSSIYQMTHRNEIPHYKPNGKMIYFDRLELIEWLKRNKI